MNKLELLELEEKLLASIGAHVEIITPQVEAFADTVTQSVERLRELTVAANEATEALAELAEAQERINE